MIRVECIVYVVVRVHNCQFLGVHEHLLEVLAILDGLLKFFTPLFLIFVVKLGRICDCCLGLEVIALWLAKCVDQW